MLWSGDSVERVITASAVEIRLYTNAKMTENIRYYPRRGFRETHRACDAGYQRVYFSRFLDPQKLH